MPIFDYRAKTQNGETVDERIEAPSKIAAIMEIQNRRLTLMDIKEVKKTMVVFEWNKVGMKELSLFCKQLGQLVETGVSVHRGIELIGENHKNNFFKDILMQIVKEIKAGSSISRSLEKYSKVFPDIMIHQMKAAEDGGFLAEALKNLSLEFSRGSEFNKKIRGALMYPAFIILATIGIVWFMMAKIIPTLTKSLSNFDAELPMITKIVVAVSEFIQGYWWLMLGFAGGVIFVAYYLLKQPVYRLIFDRFLMRLPLLGNLLATMNIARIARVMSSLMGSGVGIDQTLDNAIKVTNNKAITEAMVNVKHEVINKGTSLHKALEKYPYFPKTFIQIVNIGEEAGNLSEVLEQLAEQYEEEVGESLKALTSVVNPVLMLLIGGIVGVIVVAMFVPMFSMMDAL